MSFRTNFYHYKKSSVAKIATENITADIGLFDENGHEIMMDAFTDYVIQLKNDEAYMSKVFKEDDEDDLFRSMDKSQFRNFIKHVISEYVAELKEHIIGYPDFEKLDDELKNGCTESSKSVRSYKDLRTIGKLISNQLDYNTLIRFYSHDELDIDEILDNPWKVSLGWHTILSIANLIHVYHMMDWEIEEIIILGY